MLKVYYYILMFIKHTGLEVGIILYDEFFGETHGEIEKKLDHLS